jgi:hypothetical protein
MKHARALRATIFLPSTPSLHSPEKAFVKLVHHQKLTVHPHLPGTAHVHACPYAVRHQFRILMHTAAGTVDLSPPRHRTHIDVCMLEDVCVCVCPYSCMYVYIIRMYVYMHVYIYTHTQTHNGSDNDDDNDNHSRSSLVC